MTRHTIRGTVVDENNDEQGPYVVIEGPEPLEMQKPTEEEAAVALRVAREKGWFVWDEFTVRFGSREEIEALLEGKHPEIWVSEPNAWESARARLLARLEGQGDG